MGGAAFSKGPTALAGGLVSRPRKRAREFVARWGWFDARTVAGGRNAAKTADTFHVK